MLHHQNVTQIPTMMNGIYNYQKKERHQQEMINRIAFHVAITRQLVLGIFAIFLLIGLVHIYETIQFNQIIRNTTIDCIVESRG